MNNLILSLFLASEARHNNGQNDNTNKDNYKLKHFQIRKRTQNSFNVK